MGKNSRHTAGGSSPFDSTMGSPMYRLLWQQAGTPQRTLDGDGLLREIQALSARDFADVAPGPITIEALDEQHCVCWRAYYRHPRDLRRAVTMLREAAAEAQHVAK